MIKLIDLMVANAITKDETEYSIVVDLGEYDAPNWKFGLRSTHAGGTSTRTIVIQNSNTGISTDFTNGATVVTNGAVGTTYVDISSNVIPSKYIRFSITAGTDDITSCDVQLTIG